MLETPTGRIGLDIRDALITRITADPDISGSGLFVGSIKTFPFLGPPPDRSPACAIVLDEGSRRPDTLGGRGHGRTEMDLFLSLEYQITEGPGISAAQVALLRDQTIEGHERLLLALQKLRENADPYWFNLRFDEDRRTVYGRQAQGYQIAATGFVVTTKYRNP